MKNVNDIEKMKKYYRTSDMMNLIEFFPGVSPIRNLVIIESELDFINNKSEIEMLDHIRVDSLKGRNVIDGIEVSGKKDEFLDVLRRVKKKDPLGVIVLFDTINVPSERYERYAGISVGVDVSHNVYIDAVGKGFDGREVSKSICTHERYCIPWFELRKCNITNFKQYRIYKIKSEEYKKTRDDRVCFLNSIGLDEQVFLKYIPKEYEEIPDFIWGSVINGIIKKLEKNEDVLLKSGFSNFAISGHTEGKQFCPWQMFDKSRYLDLKKK